MMVNYFDYKINFQPPGNLFFRLDYFKKLLMDFLVVQCLRILLPSSAGDMGSISGLRKFHMPWGN